jgi:hypothetical protein
LRVGRTVNIVKPTHERYRKRVICRALRLAKGHDHPFDQDSDLVAGASAPMVRPGFHKFQSWQSPLVTTRAICAT